MPNNFQLNLFALSGLLIAIVCLPFCVFILKHGKNRVTFYYLLHCFSIAIWGICAFLAAISDNPSVSLTIWIIAYSAVLFIPVFLLHSILILIGNLNKLLLILSYSQALCFLFLNIKNKLFYGIKLMFGSFYWAQGGTLYLISFVLWIFLVLIEYYFLIKFYIKVNPHLRRRIFIFGFSTLLGFSGGMLNFLPALNISVYPFGNFFIPFYLIIMTYAILRYQIFDIHIVFRKGFVYSALVALITSMYFVFVLLSERFFQGMVGYTSLVVSIIFAFIITLFFNPVRNKIQRIADRVFLGKDPFQIAQENELLRQELLRSEKLKTVATFASGMAHEIKNPLTAIRTFTEFLPQKKDDKEFLDKFSKIVGSEVEKIDDLVHQLLDYSKPAPLQIKDTDVHKLIDETLELLNNQFIKSSVNVKKDYLLSSEKSSLKMDQNQMKQVFLNLFLNAIEAMAQGGTLTVSTRDSSSQNEFVQILVQDTGCGISEKDLPNIFEPFYSKKEKGSGLGLSIVYNIINEHKGKILARSQLHVGTEIIIELQKA